MDTASLRSFATWARSSLNREVNARITAALAPASLERIEQPQALAALDKEITAAGGGAKGQAAVADKVAYTWFNRLIALRFMDANGYTNAGVVSPPADTTVGQPEVLADAKRGVYDNEVISQATHTTVSALLAGTRKSLDPQGEAYALLLADYCRYWNKAMPFMFERQGDYTELLIPANLLADDSVLNRALKVLTPDACQDVEVIGWLYQFYISERKDEVFAGFKRGKKAGAQEIPAATQLFTPHWIVRYLVENSLGRLWLLNRPVSRLAEQMDYYIAPVDEETDYLKITKPEELKVIDPACGSGHMLTYAFDLLYAIYEEEGYAPSDIPSLILTHNLHGTEIDPRAGALAAFALTMKARAKQRTFFNRRVEPNICVIQPITFRGDELAYLFTTGGDRQQELAYWQQFQHADILGSLIQPDPELTQHLAQHLDTLEDHGDIYKNDTLKRAKQVITQAQYLLPKYSVVVANPPYMGSGTMEVTLSSYVSTHLQSAKGGLDTAFVLRANRLVVDGGYVSLVTMQSWMFKSSYERFRIDQLRAFTMETLAHLGSGAFQEISGQVVSTCAFVMKMSAAGTRGIYIGVSNEPSSLRKAELLLAAIRDPSHPTRYTVANTEHHSIPGAPIAYWLTNDLRSMYSSGHTLSKYAEVKKGIDTGNHGRFLRKWFEVSGSRLASGPTGQNPESTWVRYNKGGPFRRWYGNDDEIVNWALDGQAVREESNAKKSRSNIRNQRYFFREGFTYSEASFGAFSARYTPNGAIFDSAGATIFAEPKTLTVIGALVNSSVADFFFEVLCNGNHFQPGAVSKLLVPDDIFSLKLHCEACIDISRRDWTRQETAREFLENSLVATGNTVVSVATDAVQKAAMVDASNLARYESENNTELARLYAMDRTIEVEVSPADVTLAYNPLAKTERNQMDIGHRLIEDLVSYAVGCMFGRYSLDKPGLILADQGATLQDYLAQVPDPTFTPDADNVIPIVDGDWFEDDIVQRFRQFLRTAFGEEHFEENLRFVTEALGVKNLRDYFVKSFYKDHVQRYKKRPIYWLFSSPKGSFNALIYMHRYTPTTASTVLNEYLREFQAKIRASLEHTQRANNAREADRLRKVLLELDEYEHDVLYPLASRNIQIDLDDGVKTNYPKLGAALKKIPGLEAKE